MLTSILATILHTSLQSTETTPKIEIYNNSGLIHSKNNMEISFLFHKDYDVENISVEFYNKTTTAHSLKTVKFEKEDIIYDHSAYPLQKFIIPIGKKNVTDTESLKNEYSKDLQKFCEQNKCKNSIFFMTIKTFSSYVLSECPRRYIFKKAWLKYFDLKFFESSFTRKKIKTVKSCIEELLSAYCMCLVYEDWNLYSQKIETIDFTIQPKNGSEGTNLTKEKILKAINDSIIECKKYFKLKEIGTRKYEYITPFKNILNNINNEILKKLEIEKKTFTVTYTINNKNVTLTDTFFSVDTSPVAKLNYLNDYLTTFVNNMFFKIEYIHYETNRFITSLSKLVNIEELDELLDDFENNTIYTIKETSLITQDRKNFKKYILNELSLPLPVFKRFSEEQSTLFKDLTDKNTFFCFVYNHIHSSKYYTFNTKTNQLDEYNYIKEEDHQNSSNETGKSDVEQSIEKTETKETENETITPGSTRHQEVPNFETEDSETRGSQIPEQKAENSRNIGMRGEKQSTENIKKKRQELQKRANQIANKISQETEKKRREEKKMELERKKREEKEIKVARLNEIKRNQRRMHTIEVCIIIGVLIIVSIPLVFGAAIIHSS